MCKQFIFPGIISLLWNMPKGEKKTTYYYQQLISLMTKVPTRLVNRRCCSGARTVA